MPPKRSTPSRAPRPSSALAPPSAPEAVPAGVTLPYPKGGWRVASYLFAFFMPSAGLVLALLYWQGPDGRSRRFSRWCLFLALAGSLMSWMGGAVWSGMQNAESGIQPW
jgi:hypothetical protein